MARPHKYRAQPVVINGVRFASKAEAARYGQLRLLAQAGQIRCLRLQPTFVLQEAFTRPDGKRVRAIKYIADFSYCDNTGREIVEDVKGVETPVFRLKQKLFWRAFPHLELRIIKGG